MVHNIFHAPTLVFPRPDGMLDRTEYKRRGHRRRAVPAQNPAGVGVDDERDSVESDLSFLCPFSLVIEV